MTAETYRGCRPVDDWDIVSQAGRQAAFVAARRHVFLSRPVSCERLRLATVASCVHSDTRFIPTLTTASAPQARGPDVVHFPSISLFCIRLLKTDLSTFLLP